METKDELVAKEPCIGCLCIGRHLVEVSDHKLQQFYLEALGEMHLTNCNVNCIKLCIQCTVALRKAVTFRDQVKDCFYILQTYTGENIDLLSDIASRPRLQHHIMKSISITPIDCLTSSQDFQINQELVKEEVKAEWDEDIKSPTNIPNYEDDIIDSRSLLEERDIKTLEIEITRTEIETTNQLVRKRKKKLGKVDKRKCDKKTVSLAEKVRKRLKTVSLAEKVRKRLKTGKNKKQKRHVKSDVNDPTILTVELSYEEMLKEREVEMEKDSYIESKYKCETCIMVFSCKETYEDHNTSHHYSQDIGDYVCPICKTVTVSKHAFKSHYKRHMKRYECPICSCRTLDRQVMREHCIKAHEVQLNTEKYTCDVCGKVSNTLDKHRYHKDSHRARIQCPKCDKTFSHRAGLTNHRLAIHEFANEFSCSLCNKKFKWKTSLRRHLDQHNAEDKQSNPAAECELCAVTFRSISSYQRHLRNSLRHVTHDDHKYICDHCKRRFSDKTKLRNHIEEKHLHKAFQCPICSKSSKNRINLDQHIRNVHKRRPKDKMCHHCGKGFPTKAQLESHIRTHTGERPFICEICPATFSQQSNLYKHTRLVHKNIKHKRYPNKKSRVTDGKRTETSELRGGVTTEPLEPAVMINFTHDNKVVQFKYCYQV